MRPKLQVDSFHVVCRFLAKFDGGLGLAALLWEAGEGGMESTEWNSIACVPARTSLTTWDSWCQVCSTVELLRVGPATLATSDLGATVLMGLAEVGFRL